ncbi:hypothetical protein ACN2C7_05250 [Caulobacter sp. ErkDOM-E]|uniref:hypothetical protein n=1 Tax=Caulobacter sp. ErkDOM-E TaxID=3402778 RepID=UPI003AF4DF68
MTDRDSGTTLVDPSLASAPTPVTPTPFGIPWSIWFWGGLLSLSGAAFALAPFHAAGILRTQLDPAAEPWARMFGLMIIAYSLAYHVAGWTGARTYMRASVVLRLASPLAIGVLVLNDDLPKAWMAIGLIDLAGAIWTAIELNWRPKAKAA